MDLERAGEEEAPPLRLALTVAETATATRIGKNEIYRAVEAGELKVVRIGRRIVIPVVNVESWLEERSGV